MDFIFKNYTPHPINLQDGFVLQSSGVARCEQQDGETYMVGTIPVCERAFKTVVGLPEPEDGVGLIVSNIVAQACPERRDLYFPGDLRRDGNGNVVGVKTLCQVPNAQPKAKQRDHYMVIGKSLGGTMLGRLFADGICYSKPFCMYEDDNGQRRFRLPFNDEQSVYEVWQKHADEMYNSGTSWLMPEECALQGVTRIQVSPYDTETIVSKLAELGLMEADYYNG